MEEMCELQEMEEILKTFKTVLNDFPERWIFFL